MKTLKLVITIATVAFIVVLSGLSIRRESSEEKTLAYKPGSEIETRGVITQIDDYYCPLGKATATHLMLRTELGDLTVHLGPTTFHRNQQLELAKGQEVKVFGSKVRYQGKDMLIAREITVGNETYLFRDPKGDPLWK